MEDSKIKFRLILYYAALVLAALLTIINHRCDAASTHFSRRELDPNNNDHNGATKVADSIRIDESVEKIRLKLANGQVLVGNRKVVYFNFSKSKPSITKKIIYEFLGLPFAKAPTGDKRFRFPERLDKLLPDEVYDATYHRPSCIQELDTTFPGFKGAEMWNAPGNISEDCLYFNLWVPVTHEQDDLLYKFETLNNLYNPKNINYNTNAFKSANQLKTSLIWFYGGSFNSGSANLAVYNGTLLAAFENVIVMTPNYRLGPFGFLYLNSSAAPGNAGLADQILAIEWYKENYVDYFGGLTSNICLFGESAGAMSLHYLLLSEKRNLFNRVILQSSSSYSDLTYHSPKDSYQVWLSYAERVGCLKIKYDNENMNITDPLKLKLKKVN
jgi:carboxylesterase type B